MLIAQSKEENAALVTADPALGVFGVEIIWN
jgi:hypothetical protein